MAPDVLFTQLGSELCVRVGHVTRFPWDLRTPWTIIVVILAVIVTQPERVQKGVIDIPAVLATWSGRYRSWRRTFVLV